MIWPSPFRSILQSALAALYSVKGKGVSIEDAAEATLTLYDIVVAPSPTSLSARSTASSGRR
jgi:hypothetical protein